MDKLELSEDEYVLKKYDNVWYYIDGKGHGGELYITNKNLLFLYKMGLLKTTYRLLKTSLSKIKNSVGSYNLTYNDEEEVVEIYYPGGYDEYSFDDEEIANKFIYDLEECLSKIVLEQENEITKKVSIKDCKKQERNICIKCGQNNVADAKFCSNCGADLFTTSNLPTKNDETNNSSICISRKCKSCGAILYGNIGQSVKCEYCDFVQIL